MGVEKTATIGDMLSYFSNTCPDAKAAVQGDIRLSYSQLKAEVDTVSKALIAAGVEVGDRVGVMAPSGLEFYFTYLATVSIGGIWFGLNPRYQEPEYKYLLHDTRPKILFTVSPFEDRDYSTVLQNAGLEKTQYFVYGTPTKSAKSYESFIEKAASISDTQLLARQNQIQAEDIAAIVYTSGSTGEPKGAMLSHRAIVKSAIANAKWMEGGPHKALCCLPINHVASLNNLCMNVMAGGGCMIFHDQFDLSAIMTITKSEQLTYMLTSPTFLMMLLAYDGFNLEDLQSLRLIIFGGAVTPEDLIKQYQPIGAKLATIYGLSETCGIISHSALGANLDIMANTIGTPIEGAEWRICGTDGKIVGLGEVGELQIKGPHILSGYFNKPEASTEAMTADGFFKTGDLCTLRGDGNVEFSGRLKEMFKSGAYNVYPLEVERAIENHEQVAMAVVIGIPDDLYQEVGFAFVKPKPGQSISVPDLKAFLRTQIANYKIPKRFRLVDDFPTLPNTKVDKIALKKMLEENNE
ncbi:MAG: hypothetical protein COA91_07940 [Robiginitomaculum sp.]|nr:MAG: hypothetical protein COA91_07940 [Robiginitomaculum sp.]